MLIYFSSFLLESRNVAYIYFLPLHAAKLKKFAIFPTFDYQLHIFFNSSPPNDLTAFKFCVWTDDFFLLEIYSHRLAVRFRARD